MATAFSPKNVHQRAREALLSSNWWAAAIRGVIAILIGAFAIFAPAATLIALVMIFAAYALVDGVFAIVLAIRGARKHERWGWLLAQRDHLHRGGGDRSPLPRAHGVCLRHPVRRLGDLFGVGKPGRRHPAWEGAWPLVADPGWAHRHFLRHLGGARAAACDARTFLHGRLPGIPRRFHALALAYRLREQRVDRREEDLDRTAPTNAREAHHHG